MSGAGVTVAALALTNCKWDVPANLDRLRRWVAAAAREGANLVVAPEAYLDGYCLTDFYDAPPGDDDRARYRGVALEWPSASPLQELAALSRDHGLHIICGGVEQLGADLYNTAFIFGPAGPVGRYHKTHIGWERLAHTPGDEFPVFDAPWGRFGVLICFDRQFPEAARQLALAGAALIVVPSNGMYGGINDTMMLTRAYENSAYVVFAHPLDALIISPRGRLLAANEERGRDEMVLRQLDLAHALELRALKESLISERRPELVPARLANGCSAESSTGEPLIPSRSERPAASVIKARFHQTSPGAQGPQGCARCRNPFFPVGKLPNDVLARLIARYVRPGERVVLGPGVGRDAAVIDMGSRYLVEDHPITFATGESAWYLVNVNANDIATTGAIPAGHCAPPSSRRAAPTLPPLSPFSAS